MMARAAHSRGDGSHRNSVVGLVANMHVYFLLPLKNLLLSLSLSLSLSLRDLSVSFLFSFFFFKKGERNFIKEIKINHIGIHLLNH